ncbi:MAG: E3 ubiquitin ligase family protein [Gammaproteobacteria bacterium]|nr:E3 ubiquitin ligase family protein [Gammaproteobacteria bacterium]
MSWWLTDFGNRIGQADPAGIVVAIVFLSAAAAFVAWRCWHHLHKARTIEDIPTAKAGSAHQGYVELEGIGKLMGDVPTTAPLSGLPCVWYRYRVEELRRVYAKGGTRQRWVTVEKGESKETFWLEDETGRIAVDPEGADVSPKHKDVWRSRQWSRGSKGWPAFVIQFLTSRSGGSYRFTEQRINPNDGLYAIGLLKNLGSHMATTTVDEDVRELLRQWKSDQATLKQRFDLNEDGKIDEKEWRLARSQARREARQARQESVKEFSEGINLMTRTNDRTRPYIISAYPQEDLVKSYHRWAMLYGVGFFVLGSAGLWLFNTRLG